MQRALALALVCLAPLSACASAVWLRPGAEKVQVLEKAPDARRVGPLLGVHGKGCGIFARRGNREGALNNLKNRALEAGADRVVIKGELPPYNDGFCQHGAYLIEAVAFSTKPKPAAAAPVSATAAPSTPRQVVAAPPPAQREVLPAPAPLATDAAVATSAITSDAAGATSLAPGLAPTPGTQPGQGASAQAE
jgi:hypothetical protein